MITIIKYGLMIIKTNHMLTVSPEPNSNGYACIDISCNLGNNRENTIWLVDHANNAEYVRRNPTEWYNADHDTPAHDYEPEELKVVKYKVDIEDVDVSALDAYNQFE